MTTTRTYDPTRHRVPCFSRSRAVVYAATFLGEPDGYRVKRTDADIARIRRSYRSAAIGIPRWGHVSEDEMSDWCGCQEHRAR